MTIKEYIKTADFVTKFMVKKLDPTIYYYITVRVKRAENSRYAVIPFVYIVIDIHCMNMYSIIREPMRGVIKFVPVPFYINVTGLQFYGYSKFQPKKARTLYKVEYENDIT